MFGKKEPPVSERPVSLPPLPYGWPTRGSKVYTNSAGWQVLSHPQRESLVLHKGEWKLPTEVTKKRRRKMP
jgi:hypothetical protein